MLLIFEVKQIKFKPLRMNLSSNVNALLFLIFWTKQKKQTVIMACAKVWAPYQVSTQNLVLTHLW